MFILCYWWLYKKFAKIARVINEDNDKLNDKEASEEFINELDKICSICEIPTLKEYGINKDEFYKVIDKMAGDAMNSGSPSNTIKDISKQDLINIYEKLWK